MWWRRRWWRTRRRWIRRPLQSTSAKQGDIEFWHGKDTCGQLRRSRSRRSTTHTQTAKSPFHELPDNADQQRQQMIQNTQIKNPKMAVLSVDVVWTAEFAAKGYVEALPPDSSRPTGLLSPRRRRGDLLQQAVRLPGHIRRRPALLPQGPARQVRPAAADHPSTR